MNKPRRVFLESRSVPDAFPSTERGGIFDEMRNEHTQSQIKGETIVPLAPEKVYKDDSLRSEPDKKPLFANEVRDVRLYSATKKNGEPIPLHYQREWLRLNPDGLTHDLIHLAVTNVLRKKGFLSEASDKVSAQKEQELYSFDYEGWPEHVLLEEVIVDALEIAGIREGKVSENFWSALDLIAEKHGVTLPEIPIEVFADITKEIDRLTTESTDGDIHAHPLP